MTDAGMVLVRDGDGRYHLEHIGEQFSGTGESNVNPFWVKMTKDAEKRMIRAAIIKGYEMAFWDTESYPDRLSLATKLDRMRDEPKYPDCGRTAILESLGYSKPEHTPIPKETP